MTTFAIHTAHPNAGSNNVGYAAPVASGLSLDDTVTGAGASKSLLDEFVGSTSAIKIGKWLAEQQRADKYGRQWLATSDGGTTYIKPTL